MENHNKNKQRRKTHHVLHYISRKAGIETFDLHYTIEPKPEQAHYILCIITYRRQFITLLYCCSHGTIF